MNQSSMHKLQLESLVDKASCVIMLLCRASAQRLATPATVQPPANESSNRAFSLLTYERIRIAPAVKGQ